jgi:competence protein ComGF
MRTDLREDIAQLRSALERVVPRELYDVKHEALKQRVELLEKARERDAEQRRSDRRWLIGVVAVPIIITVVQILIQLRGGG